MAILHYEKYDHFPVVSFGYWNETLEKWAAEGHITQEEADGYAKQGDNSPADNSVMKRLGADRFSESRYLRPQTGNERL